MLHSFMSHHAVLYLRGHLAHSLTSAVELAQRTRSNKHIAFAERLLTIKCAASDAHLCATTGYKGYMNYRARSDQTITRNEKYLGFKQRLDKIKETKRFLAGLPPYEMNTSYKPTWCLASVRRDLNNHLSAAFPASSGAETITIMINALYEKVKGGNNTGEHRIFTQLAKDIHAMINAGKSLHDIGAVTARSVLATASAVDVSQQESNA